MFELGFVECISLILSYIKAQVFLKNPKNYAEQLTAKFGKRLFDIFFKDYIEKIWGVSYTELSADCVAGRVKGFLRRFIKRSNTNSPLLKKLALIEPALLRDDTITVLLETPIRILVIML